MQTVMYFKYFQLSLGIGWESDCEMWARLFHVTKAYVKKKSTFSIHLPHQNLQALFPSYEWKGILWHAQNCSTVESHHSYDTKLIKCKRYACKFRVAELSALTSTENHYRNLYLNQEVPFQRKLNSRHTHPLVLLP